ncbi:unnamed protein product [Pleuronectes platessa]|uniref:Uncharacterized protein n=1 Tax=Pleuronectes platessa TaxID=8262 RepID=A0A9N7ZBY5_PLEPL|nr:unnamed protein product [Pleuronectes platessa]
MEKPTHFGPHVAHYKGRCEPEMGIETADTGAEPVVVHTFARECESLIYSSTWFIESTPAVRLQCSCLAPQLDSTKSPDLSRIHAPGE